MLAARAAALEERVEEGRAERGQVASLRQLVAEADGGRARVEEEVLATARIATGLEARLRAARAEVEAAQRDALAANDRCSQVMAWLYQIPGGIPDCHSFCASLQLHVCLAGPLSSWSLWLLREMPGTELVLLSEQCSAIAKSRSQDTFPRIFRELSVYMPDETDLHMGHRVGFSTHCDTTHRSHLQSGFSPRLIYCEVRS